MTNSAKSVTKTSRVVNNKTGVTKSVSVTKTGGKTTISRTTTIGKAKATAGGTNKAVTQPAKAAATVLAGEWITGPNDTRDLCGPVALANALLAATGIHATNSHIERLYRQAGGLGDSGVPVPHLLAEAAASGLAGCALAGWHQLPGPGGADLVLMELPDGLGVHAAALTAGQAVMWGAETSLDSLDAVLLGAWSLTWH